MIPRTLRFSRNNFETSRRRMKPFRVGDFLFLYRLAKESRFAAVCSKKVDKRAPKRNYVRRQLYQALLNTFEDTDIILQSIVYFRGKSVPIGTKPYSDAVTEFKRFVIRKSANPSKK